MSQENPLLPVCRPGVRVQKEGKSKAKQINNNNKQANKVSKYAHSFVCTLQHREIYRNTSNYLIN